jgi:hypothetical protein
MSVTVSQDPESHSNLDELIKTPTTNSQQQFDFMLPQRPKIRRVIFNDHVMHPIN